MKKKLKDFIACFSLSTIIVLGPSLNRLGSNNYFLNFKYLRLSIIFSLLLILLVSYFFYVLKNKGLFSKNKFLKYSTSIIFLVSLACFFRALLKIIVFDMKPAIFIFSTITTLVLSIFFIIYFLKNPKNILTFATIFFVIFFPFSLFVIYKASIGFFSYKQEKVQVFKNNKPKVIWIIFDEWDQYLSFENRPKNIELSELDNLKQNYFYAKKVFQPGTDTIISIPAYTTGKKILNSQALGFNHLQLNFPDKSSSLWHQQPSIFSKLHSMKINSAVAGFFHPYERIFNKSCVEKYSYFNNRILDPFYQIIAFYIAGPLNKLAFNKIKFLKTFKTFFDATGQTHQYLGVKQNAMDLMKNKDINFCFIHFSIPHLPSLRCTKTKIMSQKIGFYSENLILMDKTITEIRQELEKSNLWEDSTLILTSDHWLRNHFWKTTHLKLTKEEVTLCNQRKEALVPLIIKMPHQKKAISYDKSFNAIALHNLVLDIYKDKVSNEKDLVSWLDNLDDSLKKP